MIVADSPEDNAYSLLQATKKVGEQPKLGCGVGRDNALATLPFRRFDQNIVTKLGDIYSYQSSAGLSSRLSG